MNTEWSKEDFLKNVEDGQQNVYTENPQKNMFKMLVPMMLGATIGMLLMAVYLIFWNPIVEEIFMVLILAPTLIGVAITFGLGMKMSGNELAYGVRGMDRNLLSQAIHFLDMLSQGEANIGEIEKDQKPEELGPSINLTFGVALYVLRKIDAEMAKMWFSSLKEKLKQESSAKSTWLLRITIGGILIMIPLVVVLEMLRELGIVSTELAFPVMLGLIGIVILFVVILALYAVKSNRDGVPGGVLLAISEPQVRFDTERALEKLIEVIKTEGKYPLRVLVLGEHEELTYTDRLYTTSKGYTLRAAVLIPESFPNNLDEKSF